MKKNIALKLLMLLVLLGVQIHNVNAQSKKTGKVATSKQSKTLKKIYFNLYVDSIKPVMRYYVNVDGEFTDGTFLPMDKQYITITANHGSMEGNDWIAPKKIDFGSVTFIAQSIHHPEIKAEITVPMRTSWNDDEGVLDKKDVMK